MFLVGQQYENQIADAAHLQYDRLEICFDPVITSFKIQPPKTETAGAALCQMEI
jgi:hypothetical protein